MNVIRIALLALGVLSFFSAGGETAERTFPFPMEGEGLWSLWTTTRPPAGSDGFIRARGNDFVDAKGNVRRFLGINLYGPAQLCDRATADATARQLRYWGITAIRLFPQYTWQMRADKDFSKGVDPELLDRFDYFFAKLKENGIHATMNLHSARTAGYRFRDFKSTMKENKGLDNFDPVFIEHQKEFCRTIFEHVNPYTKLAYRDEPAIISWEINNECSIVESWYRGGLWEKMLPPFRAEFTRQFNDWLKARDGEMAKPCEIGEANETDVGEFLIATETRYWHEMIRYLREDLKAKQLVNGGTLEYGATYPHVAGDFLDSHVYYGGLSHFPKKRWSMEDWFTGNRALSVEPDRGMVRRGMTRVFESRVFGRPYTISECGQMHQQTTAADFFPIFMALGAFQNVSAIYAYTWTHVPDHSYQSKKWLDMHGNAKYLAHWPAARNIFERGDVASGFTRPARAVHDWTCAAEREHIIRTKFAMKLQDRPTDPFAFLKAPTGTRYTDLDVTPTGVEGVAALAPVTDWTNCLRRTMSSTGELAWDATTAGRERFAVDTPRTKFVSMFGPKGASHAFKDGTTVTLGDTLLNWAAISLTETKPQHWLLAATGWQQPTGAVVQVYGGKVLKPHEEAKMLGKRITTCASMGDVPFMCEGVRATVRLPVAKEFCAYVTPLDGNARPFGRTRILEPVDGFVEFSISEEFRTLWYRVELRRFNLPAFGDPIPASAYDPKKPDVGMSAAKVFDAPIAGLTKIGQLRIPSAKEMPETSSASIGFEGLDRGLFNPTDDLYAKLGASGVKRARVQTMWSRCETEKGRYDFNALDEIVDKLLAQGIRPWFSVSFGNTLYMKGCYTKAAVGCVPLYYGEECRAAWIRYVGELAKRYRGKVHEWEVWNESNIDHFWQPHPANARDYLELVKITKAAIRAEIPDAKIGGCSSSMGVMAWERAFFEAGGAREIDFWCSHAYEQVPENYRGEQRVASKGAKTDYVSGIADMRAFIDAHGGRHVALWQGESGFPSWFPKNHWLFVRGVCQEGWQSEANQAKWLLRRWLTDRRAGQAVSSFYQASDIVRHYSMGHTTQAHPAEHGILNGWTNEPKMSYYALGHYNALFATARFDASVDVAVTPGEDQGARTCAYAFRDAEERPLFVYYSTFNFARNYEGKCCSPRTDATLSVPEALAPREPVLVDMLRGGVYALGAGRRENGRVVFTGLPLTDYPLALADRARARIADNRCAVAAYGENEIRLYASPLAYEVVRDGRTVVAKTPIGLTLDGVSVANAACRSVVEKKLSGTVATPVYKKSSVDLSGVETRADFGGFAVRLVARADGVAYRFELKKAARIDDETAGVTIPPRRAVRLQSHERLWPGGDGAGIRRCARSRRSEDGAEETVFLSSVHVSARGCRRARRRKRHPRLSGIVFFGRGKCLGRRSPFLRLCRLAEGDRTRQQPENHGTQGGRTLGSRDGT